MGFYKRNNEFKKSMFTYKATHAKLFNNLLDLMDFFNRVAQTPVFIDAQVFVTYLAIISGINSVRMETLIRLG
jgi:hypothetical protein